jgi:hypothetical protein
LVQSFRWTEDKDGVISVTDGDFSVRRNPGMSDSTTAGPEGLLLGLWDLRTEPLTLGGALTLAVEMSGYLDEQRRSSAGICFVWDADHPLPVRVSASGLEVEELIVVADSSPVVKAMAEIGVFHRLYAAGSIAAVRAFVAHGERNIETWPRLGSDGSPLSHEHGASLNIQSTFQRRGRMPQIVFTEQTVKRAKDLIQSYAEGTIPIIVHIKNDPTAPVGETACLAVWEEFLNSRSGDSDKTFILIGNEDIGNLGRQDNVVVAREFGNDLSRDLAMIQLGAAFMGIASGPAQMAILGKKPYAIFKPQFVHPEFMALEFGGLPTFRFALGSQRFIRIDPSAEDISDALNSIYDAVLARYVGQSAQKEESGGYIA